MIIGITGTIGAGKGTAVDYLVAKYGFLHFSIRDFLTEEIVRRHLPVSRTAMVEVAIDLRRQYGVSYIAEQLYSEAMKKGVHAIIESLRAPAEIIYLKEQNDFILIAIDASTEVRYERIKNRGGVTDCVTFEQFQSEEKREMQNPDPSKQSILECMNMANIVIMNTDTIEDFHKKIDQSMIQFGISRYGN